MKTAKQKISRTIDPPDLPASASLESRELSSFAADSYEMSAIEGVALNDSSASRLQFDTCVLTRIELDRTTLSNLRMIDVRVEKSSAANGIWAKPNLRRVAIVGCRLTGLTVTEGDLSDVLFQDCKADFLRLASSRIRHARFENCLLAEAEFNESIIERVVFDGAI
ncbi:MAG TPA: pentapeptide repeat-containing protein [Candidatus Binatus sp.]|nr:pentapeptide repeat-containing protein [Candidatus Binatus sp.]